VAAPVVLLSGGTGGAKLARGLADVVGDDLVVVANTGDDIEIHGAHVSPDPDLIAFWLADRIDERGWGLHGDSFAVMEGLRELGEEVWFALGDRDLAIGLRRARRLAEGARLTDTLSELTRSLGIGPRVLPMSDEPVRTRVRGGGRWWPVQEWLIRGGEEAGPVEDIDFAGADAARATPEVLAALASARAVIVGPSNPVISIGPILALPGMREAIRSAPAPVVAVSPVVGGQVLKGPTRPFMAWADQRADAEGIAALYEGLIDGLVADERPALGVALLETDTLMDTPEARRRIAGETLRFAEGLSSR
jgi:LPPG:FO 2-phospho-L-lactate transferase